MTTRATAATPSAEDLRAALVDRLRRGQVITTQRVEDAMRAVPRHAFVPGARLEDAYANRAIVTHWDGGGVAVSSASAPGAVAGMLEQLDVRPGNRVLEIGAGTGYNAALLACLAGPEGEVTTVDIDPDVTAGASRGLASAGAGDVLVACGDGEFGHAGRAPYDRIIVTAGAWDLPPAWSDQLAPGGRLVVPLRMRGLTRSVAFERQDGYWLSRSIDEVGFVPMRGAGEVAERNLRLGTHADLTLRVDDSQPTDDASLAAAPGYPPALTWTGIAVPGDGLGGLDFWLATVAGFGRLILHSPAPVSRGLADPVYDWGSMTVFSGGTFAYLARRPAPAPGPSPAELGVYACGPDSAELAGLVVGRIRDWDRDRRSIGRLWIEARPVDAPVPADAWLAIAKRHTRVLIRTSPQSESI